MTADRKKQGFDFRLWSTIALALFIIGWFVPLAGKDGNETMSAMPLTTAVTRQVFVMPQVCS